jgi:hypothetical protein
MLALVLGFVVAGVLTELVCQGYAIYIERTIWKHTRKDPHHFFQKSDSRALGYVHKPGFDSVDAERRLHINAHGLREDSDEIPTGTYAIALLGDSVVFANFLSQEQTISRYLQQRMDPFATHVSVLNFGTNGYGFDQYPTFLERMDAIYHVDHVILVINPNDFSRRNTVTEGSDNGLYRAYYLPLVKTPWMIRKVIYRLIRGTGAGPSVRFYEWLYRHDGGRWLDDVKTLAAYTRDHDQAFTVIPFPSGVAIGPNGYLLQSIHDEMIRSLRDLDIDTIDVRPALMPHVEFYDGTDHLTPEGNDFFAGLIEAHLREHRRGSDPGTHAAP